MGVAIKLYHINSRESLEGAKELEGDLNSKIDSSADLYKLYHDLAIVLTNNIDPYDDVQNMGYKLIFGNKKNNIPLGLRFIQGFISSDDMKLQFEWIQKNGLDTPTGFFEYYDQCSVEVKEEIEEIMCTSKEEISIYMKSLVRFYEIGAAKNYAALICSE